MVKCKTVQVKIVYTEGLDYNNLKNLSVFTREDVINADKFAVEEDKTQRLVSAYLKRKYVGEWNISEQGKPVSDKIFFNVSHCSGATVIALADRNVGVDIEKIRPVADKLKDYVAASGERAEILTDEDFFRVWTAKESLVKAEGFGVNRKPKEIPALPFDGIKRYLNKTYYSRNCVLNGFVLSITLKGKETFKIDLSEEKII